MQVGAIIVGAGESLRFGSPKQFKLLDGDPLILFTLRPFLASDIVDSVILVVPEETVEWTLERISKNPYKKDIKVVSGGIERQDSVFNGLQALSDVCDVAVIHDAVRPFVRRAWIEETARLCDDYTGAIMAIEAVDTLKRVQDRVILDTVERKGVWQAQTPQAFRRNSLASAFEKAHSQGWRVTDESQMVEKNGGRVAVVRGSPSNIKITSLEDWDLAVSLWEGMKGG